MFKFMLAVIPFRRDNFCRTMRKAKRKNGKGVEVEYVGVHLTRVEAGKVDFAATVCNDKCPKRSEGLRHLIDLGFRQLVNQSSPPHDVQGSEPEEAVA